MFVLQKTPKGRIKMAEAKMQTTGNRVMALYRVSTKVQVDKNDIPMQKQSCREFAQRQGWCIIKEFQEKGYPVIRYRQKTATQ